MFPYHEPLATTRLGRMGDETSARPQAWSAPRYAGLTCRVIPRIGASKRSFLSDTRRRGWDWQIHHGFTIHVGS